MIRILGVLIIAAGVAALLLGGVTYTSREKILDLGPLQATADREKTLVVPPAVGAGVVGFGTLLLLLGGRRKK